MQNGYNFTRDANRYNGFKDFQAYGCRCNDHSHLGHHRIKHHRVPGPFETLYLEKLCAGTFLELTVHLSNFGEDVSGAPGSSLSQRWLMCSEGTGRRQTDGSQDWSVPGWVTALAILIRNKLADMKQWGLRLKRMGSGSVRVAMAK